MNGLGPSSSPPATLLSEISVPLSSIGLVVEYCSRTKHFKVISVAEDSPSGQGQRIVVGDVVTEFNGEQIHCLNNLPAVQKRSLRRESKFTFLRVHKSPDFSAVDIAIPRSDALAPALPSEVTAKPQLVVEHSENYAVKNASVISNADTVAKVTPEPGAATPMEGRKTVPHDSDIAIVSGDPNNNATSTEVYIDRITIPPVARPDYLTNLLRKNSDLSRELREANMKLQTLQTEKELLQEELEKAQFALAEKEAIAEASASRESLPHQEPVRSESCDTFTQSLETGAGAVFEEASYISDIESDFGSNVSWRSGSRNGGRVVEELRTELQRTRNRLQESLIHSGLWDLEDARDVRGCSYNQAMDDAYEALSLNMLALKPDFEQRICLDSLSMLLSWTYKPWASDILLRNIAGGMRILARVEANKEGLLEVGCVEAMVYLIKSALEGAGHWDAAEHASACISNLALKHGPSKERILHSGGVGLLLRILEREEFSSSMKAKACSTLSHLACAPAIKKAMMREGAVEVLIYVCSVCEDEELVTEAVRAMRNLASRCEIGCIHILSVGGIDVLGGLCMHSRSEKVVRNAAAAISNLCSNETCRSECKKKFRWDAEFGARMVARVQEEDVKAAQQHPLRALKSSLSRRTSTASSHQTPRVSSVLSRDDPSAFPRRVVFAGDTLETPSRRPSSASARSSHSMPERSLSVPLALAAASRSPAGAAPQARPRSASRASSSGSAGTGPGSQRARGRWDAGTKRELSFRNTRQS